MSALVRIHEITHHVGEGDGARHAAIYQHQYTINEGGVVRCQEQCSGGNFVRRAKSGGILHRLERLIHSRRVRRPAMKGRGFDYTRQNAVAANALLTERSEEHTSELQSLMRISYAVFCLKKKKNTI